jgi:hypothetical protein
MLTGLDKLLRLPHEIVLDKKKLACVFAWPDQPQLVWPQLSAALVDKRLDEVVIIDFPKGKVRERIFTTKDLYKKSWAFWKKAEPLTWKEITQA